MNHRRWTTWPKGCSAAWVRTTPCIPKRVAFFRRWARRSPERGPRCARWSSRVQSACRRTGAAASATRMPRGHRMRGRAGAVASRGVRAHSQGDPRLEPPIRRAMMSKRCPQTIVEPAVDLIHWLGEQCNDVGMASGGSVHPHRAVQFCEASALRWRSDVSPRRGQSRTDAAASPPPLPALAGFRSYGASHHVHHLRRRAVRHWGGPHLGGRRLHEASALIARRVSEQVAVRLAKVRR